MGRDDGRCGEAAGRELAGRLRSLRDRTGRSLKELQKVVHVSDSSLSRYFSGRILPPWDVVERLADLADEEPSELRELWQQAQHKEHDAVECPTRPTESGFDETPWYRRRPALIALVGLVSAGLGLGAGYWLGLRSPTRTGPMLRQDEACETWPWPSSPDGQVAIPPTRVHGDDHAPAVRLVTGSPAGQPLVWAQIVDARYGDRVWMDWSQDAGKTWTQCGPFTTTGSTLITRAHPAKPGWVFRACGDTPRPAAGYPRDSCTAYW